eukprot:scaffold647162_cov17-Prasinocladus_malaysianus.AAC.1
MFRPGKNNQADLLSRAVRAPKESVLAASVIVTASGRGPARILCAAALVSSPFSPEEDEWVAHKEQNETDHVEWGEIIALSTVLSVAATLASTDP